MFEASPNSESFDASLARSHILPFSQPQCESARISALSGVITFLATMIQTTRRQDYIEAGHIIFQQLLELLSEQRWSKYILEDVHKQAAGAVCMCQNSRSMASLVISFFRCDQTFFLFDTLYNIKWICLSGVQMLKNCSCRLYVLCMVGWQKSWSQREWKFIRLV